MVYAKGTAGLYEIEPSMRWNPAVVAGVGMIQDPRPLYDDMHAYLAQSGAPHPSHLPSCHRRGCPAVCHAISFNWMTRDYGDFSIWK